MCIPIMTWIIISRVQIDLFRMIVTATTGHCHVRVREIMAMIRRSGNRIIPMSMIPKMGVLNLT